MTHKQDGSVLRRAVGALLGVFALVAGLLAAGAGPAQAEPAPVLPGGKKNWVVSVGGLDTAAGNDYRNWVRIGYYEFHTDGTVVTHYWNWSQRTSPSAPTR